MSRWRGLGLALLLLAGSASAQGAETRPWPQIERTARNQTVYWNAWGGDEKINAYIAWTAGRVKALYGVNLRHVKLADTAEAVTRVRVEQAAGRSRDGSVDLIWINGENFAAMKQAGQLYGPFAPALPNYRLLDLETKPTMLVDFTVATDGYEAPWGLAKLVFFYDSKRLHLPPRSVAAIGDWARSHPGRFTYPQPPDFTGTSFLKQALYELTPDPARLARPVDEADFAAATRPLWAWLEAVRPFLWRGGRSFPASEIALRQLVNDGEVDIGFSFNPGAASAAIAQKLLPPSVRSYVLDRGTLANSHFLAIPFNAANKEGAMVVANFLLSPEAQARKQDATQWGDGTVLALGKLTAADRKHFEKLPQGVATLAPDALGRALPEPHPSWVARLEQEWRKRHLP